MCRATHVPHVVVSRDTCTPCRGVARHTLLQIQKGGWQNRVFLNLKAKPRSRRRSSRSQHPPARVRSPRSSRAVQSLKSSSRRRWHRRASSIAAGSGGCSCRGASSGGAAVGARVRGIARADVGLASFRTDDARRVLHHPINVGGHFPDRVST